MRRISTLHVERRVNLGGTFAVSSSAVAGEIDLYPNTTGTALTAILNEPPQTTRRRYFIAYRTNIVRDSAWK